jgi:glycosyltransferase involved in cell wall biosynthesis
MIPTLDARRDLLNRLFQELNNQIQNRAGIKISILNDFQELSIGRRRNILLENTDSQYVCFFDDDDLPTPYYIEGIYNAALSGCDCASLKGIYTENGANPEIFEHSIKYKEWKTNYGVPYPNIKYERTPNHLNLIKRELAVQVRFEEISFSEDKIWSDKINELGLIKTEYYIEQPIYNYLKITY